jgi:hypothetical protein
MSIWVNGDKMVSGSDTTVKQTQNNANLYIGSKGEQSGFYSGSISNLVIFNRAKTSTQIRNLYENLNGYPYVGNIFYSNGLATITNPNYQTIAKPQTHQHTYYYPLDNTHTSSLSNKGSGSFSDLGKYHLSASGYWNQSMGEQPRTSSNFFTSKKVSDATFETVTHNNFTGNILLFSSSIAQTGSDGTNDEYWNLYRGSEFVSLGGDGDSTARMGYNNYESSIFETDKHPKMPRGGKWSMSFLIKEAKGFHSTSSIIMGTDTDYSENPQYSNAIWPYLRKETDGNMVFYDRSNSSWRTDMSSSTISHEHVNFEESNYNGGAGNAPHKLQPHYFTTWSSSNHIVCTWDGTDEKAAIMTWYRNGINAGEFRRDISNNKYSGSFGIDALGGSNNGAGQNAGGFSGSLGQVRFFDYCLTHEQAKHLNQDPSGDVEGETINKLEFKGSHYIYENEYQCTVESHEYNYTHNVTARKIQSDQMPELADFTTGSIWHPYVTTIGLYNENNELLVIGKLGQPIRMSDETDTTFIVRWDA